MTAYVVIDLEINDPALIQEYESKMVDVAPRYGAKLLARETSAKSLDGQWAPSFFVIFEFPSRDHAVSFYECEEYQPLKALRQKGARSNVIAVSGIDEMAT